MANKKPLIRAGKTKELPSGDNLDINSGRVVNQATPLAATDGANKAYADTKATKAFAIAMATAL